MGHMQTAPQASVEFQVTQEGSRSKSGQNVPKTFSEQDAMQSGLTRFSGYLLFTAFLHAV